MRKICFAILLVPALAWGQPRSADEWYKEGENQYTLGNFDKAVEAFKQAFSAETNESKKAAYLYNVAQSYRQLNDCKNELFFYRRFLALKDNDTIKPLSAKIRKDVEGWINEAEVCVQQATALGKKPPTTNLPPDGDGGEKTPPSDDGHKDTRKDTHKEGKDGKGKDVSVGSKHGRRRAGGDDDDDDGEGGSVTKPAGLTTAPHLISARFTGGGTKVSAGNINVPVQFTAALVAGYPIPINDQLTIDAGAAFTFTPVPYTTSAMASETAQLISLMADAGATYEVIPQLGLRGDVGLGALFFAKVGGSPFTSFAPTSGALSMFHLRAALSADYAFTPNVIGTFTPIAVSYSPPKAGLAPDIKQISSIDFMLGIGYRM